MLLGPVAFDGVAGPAEQLQVVQVVRPASALRHHVVNGEVAEGEHHPTAVAQALLLPVEDVLVLPVGDGSLDVRPSRNVRTGGDIAVMKQAAHGLLEPHVDQFHGLRGYVYANPLAAESVSSDTGSGTSTEWVKYHVTFIGRRLDDAIQEG